MTRMMTKTILAVAAALAMAAPAAAATIQFCPDGSGTGCVSMSSFDWFQGNSIIMENGDGTATILYQSNLDSAALGTTTVFSNGDGGNYFTAAAQLNVTLAANGTFVVDSGLIALFSDTAPGDDLAGTGFTDGTNILLASVTSGGGSFNFFTPTDLDGNGSCDLFCIVPLDSFTSDGNNYPGVFTLQGAGGSATDALVLFALDGYFPDLVDGSTLMFTNTSLVDPFRQVDPSAEFFGQPGLPGVSSVGTINGTGNNIMTQADANTSFETPGSAVPEPASMLLLGTGLIGLAGRRRSRKAN